jgi:hypothetical protein
MARIPKTKVYNPQKASAYVGKGVLKNGGITPVPNGHLIKKDGTSLKNGGKTKAIVKAGGQTHKVFKKKVDRGIGDKGDIVVDHTAGPSAGKWDKINLTEKAKAKTVKQGVASVRKWHKENPNYGNSKKKSSVAKKRR